MGWVLIAATTKGVCAIAFGEEPESLTAQLHTDFPNAPIVAASAEFQGWVKSVLQWVDAPQTAVDLPLDIRGTAFQQQVWRTLQSIPAGTTLSYSQVAQRLGRPKAVRAVAQACAKNTLAIAIPCHRVVGSDGHLRGYRWGCDRKQALLTKEKAAGNHCNAPECP